MGLKQVKVFTSDLTLGMYVSRLDKPWAQTPFPIQGFYIKSVADIKELTFHCKHVYIDVERGREPVAVQHATVKAKAKAEAEKSEQKVKVKPFPIYRERYSEVKPLKKEISRAREMHSQVSSAVEDVYSRVSTGGKISLKETQKSSTELVDSVLRNPDAFTWLSRIKERDEHTWGHSVRSSVWAVLFGRHVGLGRSELIILAQGVLLKDLGKIKLPKSVLAAVDRNPSQEKLYRTFVDHSVSILRSIPNLDQRVLKVVACHCERLNGSGYPKGISGDKIPFLAKIAGIVSTYDDIANPRGASQPLSPSKAIGWLYKSRNRLFQEQLVVEFIQAVGVYPTGTLVELSTGQIGVVVEQNFERRLRPKVVLVKSPNGELLAKRKVLDLSAEAIHNHDKGLPPITIKTDLEPSTTDIDVASIRDEYLHSNRFSLRKLFSLRA